MAQFTTIMKLFLVFTDVHEIMLWSCHSLWKCTACNTTYKCQWHSPYSCAINDPYTYKFLLLLLYRGRYSAGVSDEARQLPRKSLALCLRTAFASGNSVSKLSERLYLELKEQQGRSTVGSDVQVLLATQDCQTWCSVESLVLDVSTWCLFMLKVR